MTEPLTPWQNEQKIFKERIQKLFNCWINRTFDLTLQGSQQRGSMVFILFVLVGVFIVFRYHTLSEWGTQISAVLQYMFNTLYRSTAPNTLTEFITFTQNTLLAPQVLRYLPVVILPYMIAIHYASVYLDDIFELNRVDIAREFIRQVALTGNYKNIRISGGEVVKEDQESPIYLIGGPGRVVVELDSAALFEKPNGQPNVIGPTVKKKAVLQGFERFRAAMDLRDQYTDQDNPLDVTSRSLDGIPISAADVRMVFSVWRNNQSPTAQHPHPFNKQSIETLIYEQRSKVITEGEYPSELMPTGPAAIVRAVRGELGKFMGQNKLATYLASIGVPEVEQAKQREKEIVKVGREVISPDDTLKARDVLPLPDFLPRYKVSNLFSEFAEKFTQNASKSGVELHWIGVGTWKMPTAITDDIVKGKHLEAWQLSRENTARGNDVAYKALALETQLQYKLRYIQAVPLARYQKNKDSRSHKDAIQEMLVGYREQLIEVAELLSKNKRKKPVPKSILEAIRHIEIVIGAKHWVGGSGPTPKPDNGGGGSGGASGKAKASPGQTTGIPSSRPRPSDEEELLIQLLQLCKGDRDLALRLIEHERSRFPHADNKDLIQRAIDRLIKDNR